MLRHQHSMLGQLINQVVSYHCTRTRAAACPESDTLCFPLSKFVDWEARWYDSPQQLAAGWRSGKENIWLDTQFLSYLMDAPQGVKAGALRLRHRDGRELALSIQFLRFQAGRQIRQEAAEDQRFGFRRWLSRFFSFKVLSVGQFMVSGRYGLGSNQGISEQELTELIPAAAEDLAAKLGGIWAILLKDPLPIQHPAAEKWQSEGYYQLPVDPSMQLYVRPEWSSLSDYLLDISSKYRVRYRRARKHAVGVHCRELTSTEVQQYSPTLYAFYHQVKAEAAFDAIDLSRDYFADMVNLFPGRFRVFGYFHKNELIGFRTSMANGPVLHAHYLGFDQSLNRQFHLYHNMLFDLLEEAINGNYEQLDYGRTALEIKSSVGAVPEYFFCALRATTPWLNWVIRRFTPAVFKAQEWDQRRPFKGG